MNYEFDLGMDESRLKLLYGFRKDAKLFRNLQIRKWLRDGKQTSWVVEQLGSEIEDTQRLYDIRDDNDRYQLIEKDYKKQLGIS